MIVKICGTTSEDDALLAVAMGADLIGFVFAPSPRQVAAQKAADIAKRLPSEIVTVGVFRNELPERVVDVAVRAGMGAVQLHGYETPEQTRWVRARIPFVIKAFAAGDERIARAADHGADAILLDAPTPGSGRIFDWTLASSAPPGVPLMIAGGLTPANVAAAIAQTRPWGVDVASGVERSPGVKDPVKLRAFIANAKAADDDAGLSLADGTAQGGGVIYDWENER
jgi:phosphoribosylanthranilate isomerase